ncbi:MAG: hypothetical protein M3Q10_03210 [Chloroflexota bacterium]|nr:hypothetical protein [Chloroflexota bacterium]
MAEPDPNQPAGPDPVHAFRLDEQAVRALRFVAELLPRAAADPYLWKWVVAATHDALHGFMALALRRTDGAQLRIPKHERQTYDRWERERQQYRPLPHDEGDRIDQFLNLFEKIQDEQRMRQFVHSTVFVPTDDQDLSVRYLDRLRNDLTHYSDTTRIVRLAELPRVVLDCVGVVDWLLARSNNVTIFDPSSEDAAKRAIREIQEETHLLGDRWAAAGGTEAPRVP